VKDQSCTDLYRSMTSLWMNGMIVVCMQVQMQLVSLIFMMFWESYNKNTPNNPVSDLGFSAVEKNSDYCR